MRSGLAAGVLGLAVFVAAPAAAALPDGIFADECTTDADCAAGLACRTQTWEECTAVVDTGEEYEEECVEVSAQVCSLKECTADSDCSGNTSCVVVYEDDCGDEVYPELPDTGGGGPRGLDKEPCEPAIYSFCIPPFLEPCNADADCGPGFVCEPDLECESTAEGENCQEIWPGSCDVVEIPCTTDAQCGAGLVCEDVTELMCGGEGGEGGTGPGDEPVDPDGESGGGTGDEDEEWSGEECEELSLCLPPDLIAWAKAVGATAGAGDDKGTYYESLDPGANDGGGGGSGSSGCAAGGAGLSLLGLLGVALLLRRR